MLASTGGDDESGRDRCDLVSGGFLSISEIDAQTDTLSTTTMLGSRKLGLLAVVSCAHALVVLNDGTFNRRSALLGAAAAASCGQAFAPAAFAAGLPTAKVETSWTLANGVAMPTLALNTAGLSADGSERALTAALPLGFTHVDFHPGTERDGLALTPTLTPKRSLSPSLSLAPTLTPTLTQP